MADDIPQGEGYPLRQSPSFGSLLPRQSSTSRGLIRANSDSDVGVSSRLCPWVCSLCKYENVDPTNNRCALCGTQQQESQSKGISALAFSSYSSSASQKTSKVQKQNPSSTSSDQVARPVTPERRIDSGLTSAPVIAGSGVDPLKSEAPTNGDKSENIGSIIEPNQDLFRKAESTSSMEKTETSDKAATLSSLNASANSISIHNSEDSTNGHGSQEFEDSAVTPPVSNVAKIRHSDATMSMSNVQHSILKDIDSDSMGSPERDGASTSDEVSLHELYAMGVVPDALTADLTAQHMKKAGSPSNQSPRGIPQSREEDTRKGAWIPPVISISPDDHNKDLEANNFQIEDPPDEISVSETEPQPPTSRMTSLVRAAFVALVILAVVLSGILLSTGSDDNGDDSAVVLPVTGAPTSQATMPPTNSAVDVPTAAPFPTAPAEPVAASPSPA
jgi:hypothetical protein